MSDKDYWIQTYTGKRFFPLAPRAEDIDIADIAHALSQQCRFTGHTSRFYSVAQHSVHVAEQCAYPIYGLLHDAAEAYLVDLPSPIKWALRSRGCHVFDEAEAAIMREVWLRFGLPAPAHGSAEELAIERADLLLLTTEARDFMSPQQPGWHHSVENGYEALPEPLHAWSSPNAERLFLAAFRRYRA